MKIKDIYEKLNTLSPFELQEEWDNSGLLVGDFENKVKKIYVTLDLDEKIIDYLEDNSLVIAHHPLIFKPIKNVREIDFSRKLLVKLIKKDISFIAMHTNFDKTHLNKYVAEKVLGLTGRQDKFIYYSDIDMSFEEIIKLVKEKLKLNYVRFVKTKERIKRIALTTGAGMSLLNSVKADLFLTGDIKYHEAMDAKVRGISLIDINHYNSEIFFVNALSEAIDFEVEKIYIKSVFDEDFNC